MLRFVLAQVYLSEPRTRRSSISLSLNKAFQEQKLAAGRNSGYISGYNSLAWESAMGDAAQKRALRNYRSRLVKRGMARFEVLGLDADRDLIRSLARRLAEDDPDARGFERL